MDGAVATAVAGRNRRRRALTSRREDLGGETSEEATWDPQCQGETRSFDLPRSVILGLWRRKARLRNGRDCHQEEHIGFAASSHVIQYVVLPQRARKVDT